MYMYDAVILSDVHLGSDLCRAKELCRFLNQVRRGRLPTRLLILNGDVFDSHDFRRLGKHHWKVLSLIRKLSDDLRIIWVCGNHDGPADVISPLLGVEVQDEYVLDTGGRRALVLHGHRFDNFINEHPMLTVLSDAGYWLLQKIDGSHKLARWAKRKSKMFVRCVSKIREGAIACARGRNIPLVCCGHTHQAETVHVDGVTYHNSGCWTESPSTYLTVADGVIEMHRFEAQVQAEAEDAGNGPDAVEAPAEIDSDAGELEPVGLLERLPAAGR